MEKRNYFEYTNHELEKYIKDNSCVKYVNGDMHLGFPPWGLTTFRETVTGIIKMQKVGVYDEKLGGIVLDVRNIRVCGQKFPVYNDSAYMHINLKVGFYIFAPNIGSVIKGSIKHIASGHISVTVFRRFNIAIKLAKQPKALKVNTDIFVKIISFDFKDSIPFIEGTLHNSGNASDTPAGTSSDSREEAEPINRNGTNGLNSKKRTKRNSMSPVQTKRVKITDEETPIKIKQEIVSESDSSENLSETEEKSNRATPVRIKKERTPDLPPEDSTDDEDVLHLKDIEEALKVKQEKLKVKTKLNKSTGDIEERLNGPKQEKSAKVKQEKSLGKVKREQTPEKSLGKTKREKTPEKSSGKAQREMKPEKCLIKTKREKTPDLSVSSKTPKKSKKLDDKIQELMRIVLANKSI